MAGIEYDIAVAPGSDHLGVEYQIVVIVAVVGCCQRDVAAAVTLDLFIDRQQAAGGDVDTAAGG
ncbi:MAG: hypothetical protein R6V62_09675, partial [Candidatus Fermentibacteraceae bacterium]